ncbi:MAG TPA: acyl-phosphate glycerol 3-phosphate acyltransferase [Firmicutes bacterium]|nr:acyl-phosphate glycerol 3-phosphate acyltransferase [Bacillota bacterium]
MIWLFRFLFVFLFSIFGYLIGAIPNSVIIGKLFFHKDPRDYGSHNAGGTNAGRVLGKKAGVIVILLDGLKIVVPFYIVFFLLKKTTFFLNLMNDGFELNAFGLGNTISDLALYLTALSGIIGHCYSIYLRFSGGKAVSTYLGTACCISYFTFPLCGSLFFGILKCKKFVSLSSLISTSAFTIFSWIIYITYSFNFNNLKIINILNNFLWFGYGPNISIYMPIVMTIASIILIIKHIPNIHRLENKSESKIHWMK